MLLAAGASAAEPVAVTSNLTKAFGAKWFEIARFDNFFQKGCVATTAQYTLTETGNFTIKNRCLKEKLDGPETIAEGKGWVPDPKEPGKWKVQFFWPFRGDLWILDVAPDFSWMLAGNPKRTSAWILSRTAKMDPVLYADLEGRLKAKGYDVTKLLKVVQP